MKRRISGLSLLLAVTWAFAVYHRAVAPPPAGLTPGAASAHSGRWVPRSELGINQLILWGTPLERGLASGALTRHLLLEQERSLSAGFERAIPSRLARAGFVLLAMRWFWGIDRHIEPGMLEEMYGVSRSAPVELDYLADGYTRQIAYHGLHEVGQMFVDHRGHDRGCTVFLVRGPQGKWMVGRNLDFEGGRIFDDEKILKWVFPPSGVPYVSVIWAGMVGAVTGVNAHGVYVSLNAAGSDDFRRFGTPTTLVASKVLETAKTAAEAVSIIEAATTFITDIFVVSDGNAAFRVEKSPKRTVVTGVTEDEVVTNHLTHPSWADDAVNAKRQRELTTMSRYRRGMALVGARDRAGRTDSDAAVSEMVSWLRDRRDVTGAQLPDGHRAAIDGLIATHSVVYDGRRLYVSRGPSLVGGFVGFDLAASFEKRAPVIVGEIPADPTLTVERYHRTKEALVAAERAAKAAKRGDCSGARRLLDGVPATLRNFPEWHAAEGDIHHCLGDSKSAARSWEEALQRKPAYLQERLDLEQKLGAVRNGRERG